MKQRFKSVCALHQSDLSLCFLPEEMLDPWLSIERTSKTLIRLRRCAGWSASWVGTYAKVYHLLNTGSNIQLPWRHIWTRFKYLSHMCKITFSTFTCNFLVRLKILIKLAWFFFYIFNFCVRAVKALMTEPLLIGCAINTTITCTDIFIWE